MIVLYDTNNELCEYWKFYFKDEPDVTVQHKRLQNLESEYVVTAGNSYGWMTGGIDLAVRQYFGQDIQDTIQSVILGLPGRYLPVGSSIVIETYNNYLPYLIYAPTMDIPKRITKTDVFYVFAKLLEKFDSFACCGLGTGVGGVNYKDCAKAMYDAYKFMRNRNEN